MTNIMDYVKKYGDISFDEEEFNEVDAAILSLISYIDFSGIIGMNKKGQYLRNALDYFLTYYDLKSFAKKGVARKDIIKLCRLIKDKARYKDILLYNYVYKLGFDEQFGAITMKLPNKTVIINYEGTDHNLVGWEEDFAMCYRNLVPSERDAIKYINKSVSLFDKEVIVLGHSKGGHLSMVAGMGAILPIRIKIKKIYNFDGPGLRKEIIKSHKYKRIKDRLNYIVPNHSIVGLILRHDDNIKVVKSVKKDLSAHSIFNWEVLDYAFKDAVLSRLSKNLDSSIVMWLDSHEDCEREKIGKAIFEFLRKNGLNDVSNLIKIRTLFMLLKNSKELDNETKKVLGNFIKFNVDYMKQNKKEKSSLS